MKLSRLYIKDFMCYDEAFLNFDEFNTALIVGKQENNENISNGVGKTTIFRAIEYVLFNHADKVLEDVIRDDIASCKIVLDFTVDKQEYRISRTRTRKGSSDLTLFRRTPAIGSDEESLHSIINDKYTPISNEKYWEDISGRRAVDTEKDLSKLIKTNLKSFRVFVHFMQHDFTGLTTATPEKRKLILKDALNLAVYSKLEKLAKDKASILSKEADRLSTLIDNFGNPDEELLALSQQFFNIEKQLEHSNNENFTANYSLKESNEKMNMLLEKHSSLEKKFSTLLVQEQNLTSDKNRIEISIKEYSSKKNNIVKSAKELVSDLKGLEETQIKLSLIDYHQIDILSETITSNREKIAQFNLMIQNDMNRCSKLKIPLPDNGECEHCRQPLSQEHRKICQTKINEELLEKQNNIQNSKKEIIILNNQNANHQLNVNNLLFSKQHMESINTNISSKKKDIAERKVTHEEYSSLLDKFNLELSIKNKEMEILSQDLKDSSLEEAKKTEGLINTEKLNLITITDKISIFAKELTHYNSVKAVLQHSINQKTEDKRKKIDYLKLLKEVNDKLDLYPTVIQAFSSTGIPNLIIQNVLDDLQIEANTLLSQLKPGLQLSFLIEKTKGDGTEADTLDIQYTVNGKRRYYELLSGAMQLAVTFSLKLGLSFLLQKMIGVDIKFLLLDEIDQSLDKASADAFADIVKFFQKDFTILVITHNDRLKDKFSHAILVEQDINMISKARVVSSW